MQHTPTIPEQMKAMALGEFGGPDKLTLHTVPVPEVGADEVLVRVEVAGVGVWDAMERAGQLVHNDVQFPRVLGGECAGTIIAIGAQVTRFSVGDQVHAQSFMNPKGGSYAQYVVVPASKVAPIPAGMSMEAAGGLNIIGATALANLNALELGAGDSLMLWGASGGVGHVALQLARTLGARVFAIASGADGVALCQSLGADEAVDGRRDNVMERARAFAPAGFDKAFTLLIGDQVQASFELVRQGGIISFPNGVVPEPVAPDGVKLVKADGYATEELLSQLNALIEQGDFKVHIAQTFPLESVAEAQRAMDKHYVGKIVLSVNEN